MNDHVSKPINTKELFGALVKWISPQEISERIPVAAEKTSTSAEGTEDHLPLTLPGLDVEAGLIVVGGKKNLYRKLLGKFERDYQDVTQTIKNAWDSDKMDEAEREVHTVKGVAANIGAKGLALSAGNIETAIRSHQIENKEQLLRQFDQDLKQVLESLASLQLEKKEATAEVDFSKTVIPLELLSSLKEAAANGNLDAIQEKLVDLSTVTPSGGALAAHFRKLIGDKKLDDINNILGKIEEKHDSTTDTPRLLDALSNLEQHVKSKKPKKCKQALQETLELNWPTELLSEIENLEKLLGKYKFKDGLEVVERLLQKLR